MNQLHYTNENLQIVSVESRHQAYKRWKKIAWAMIYLFGFVLFVGVVAVSGYLVQHFSQDIRQQAKEDFNCNNIVDIPQDECNALVKFYHSTNGVRWKDKTGWLRDIHACSWHGVQCRDGHVFSLILKDNALSGTIPAEISKFSQLVNLHLSNNQIEGSIPASLVLLEQLSYVYLNSNRLEGYIPAIPKGKLSSLRVLNLNSNRLEGEIPSSLQYLHLLDLDLGSNGLSGAIPPEIGSMVGLEKLVLADNQLTGQIPATLGNLQNLKTLHLGQNQLSGTIPNSFANLKRLNGLFLEHNQLGGHIPIVLTQLSGLKTLSLSENKFEGHIPKEVGKLKELKELFLYQNKLFGPLPRELTQLTQLDTFLFNDQESNIGFCAQDQSVIKWLQSVKEKNPHGLAVSPVVSRICNANDYVSSDLTPSTKPTSTPSSGQVYLIKTQEQTLIEAEAFTKKYERDQEQRIKIKLGDNAFDGRYIELWDRNYSASQADQFGRVRYDFIIPTTGEYHFYLRYRAKDYSSDSAYYRFDAQNYAGLWLTTTGKDQWRWHQLNVKLSPGKHSLFISAREPGVAFDMIVVVPPGMKFIEPPLVLSATPTPVVLATATPTPTQTQVSQENRLVLGQKKEFESCKAALPLCSDTNVMIVRGQPFSNQQAVQFNSSLPNQYSYIQTSPYQMSFKFKTNPARTGYWLLLKAQGPDYNSNSIFVKIDDSGPFTLTLPTDLSWKRIWVNIPYRSDHTIHFAMRESGAILDAFTISDSASFPP